MINKTNSYSVLMGLEKTFFRTVVILGPLLVGIMPEAWMNITLGAGLTFIINYAKNRDKKEVEDTVSES